MTTPERIRQVRNLFEAAMEKPPAERREFLAVASASSDDATLQEELARLARSFRKNLKKEREGCRHHW